MIQFCLLLLLLLFLSINKWKSGVKVIVTFVLLTGIYYLTSETLGLAQVFHTWALIMRRLLIPFGVGLADKQESIDKSDHIAKVGEEKAGVLLTMIQLPLWIKFGVEGGRIVFIVKT